MCSLLINSINIKPLAIELHEATLLVEAMGFATDFVTRHKFDHGFFFLRHMFLHFQAQPLRRLTVNDRLFRASSLIPSRSANTLRR